MNTIKRFLLMLAVSISLAGCGKENEESLWQETSEVENTQISDTDLAESMQEEKVKKGKKEEEIGESEKLFNQFLNNEIAAYRESEEPVFYRNLYDEEYFERFESEGIELNAEITFYDLDNDGADEIIMDLDWYWLWYGGKCFDVRDGKLYLFAEAQGTAEMLGYADYKGNTWIYHCDVSHGGREMFWFDRYQGADCIVESFSLYDEFWEGKEHTYSLNEEEISMEEYKTIYEEIFQQEYSPRKY